jgi:hypothetical protein
MTTENVVFVAAEVRHFEFNPEQYTRDLSTALLFTRGCATSAPKFTSSLVAGILTFCVYW